jgi:hypothetical protein
MIPGRDRSTSAWLWGLALLALVIGSWLASLGQKEPPSETEQALAHNLVDPWR